MFTHAITRLPGADFARGLTTAVWDAPPRYERLLDQHRAYCRTLRQIGLKVVELPPLEGLPDAYFVEDVAVVTPEAAVITIPGAASRQGEAAHIETPLARFRELKRILDPGRVDGGDVLEVQGHYFIGISERTNPDGARQLGAILEAAGHGWTAVEVGGGLHLKSGVNHLGGGVLLMTADFAARPEFEGYRRLVVDDTEAYAANTLAVNGHLLTPAGYPRTRRLLETLALPVIALEVSEVRKMDGGLTCMSLRI